MIYKEALSQAEINEIYAQYVTPSVENEIPFESHLLSFSDTLTVFVNNQPISDSIIVAPIEPVSETSSVIQSISFSDYMTFKVNDNSNESFDNRISFHDQVTATVISVNTSDDLTSISEVLSLTDSILASVNQVGIIHLTESLSLDSTFSLGDNSTLSNSITSNIQLEHDVIEINKPVTWVHDVIFSNDTESVAVEIPADAEILMIKTFNDTSDQLSSITLNLTLVILLDFMMMKIFLTRT